MELRAYRGKQRIRTCERQWFGRDRRGASVQATQLVSDRCIEPEKDTPRIQWGLRRRCKRGTKQGPKVMMAAEVVQEAKRVRGVRARKGRGTS